jgi:hypothetical protein
MKKMFLTIACLLAHASIFAGSFSCPVSRIQYDGNDPNISGWTFNISGAMSDHTYYLAASLSSDNEQTPAACMYSLDGQVDDNGFPGPPGGIWLLGAMSITGEGQWVARPSFGSKYNKLCRGTACNFYQ